MIQGGLPIRQGGFQLFVFHHQAFVWMRMGSSELLNLLFLSRVKVNAHGVKCFPAHQPIRKGPLLHGEAAPKG